MKSILSIICVFLMLGVGYVSTAQVIETKGVRFIAEAEEIFRQGLSNYRSGQYLEAKEKFSTLIELFPKHQRITAAYLMLGKTFYKLKDYEHSISIIRKLLVKYPQSSYVDDGHYTIACCYYQLSKYVASVREFLWVADYGKSQKLVEKSRILALKIIEVYLTEEDLQDLKAELLGDSASAILTIKLAQRWLDKGLKEKATALLQEFIKKYPRNEYITHVKDVLNITGSSERIGGIKIGVILPLSSDLAEQGNGILKGIVYAHNEFNRNSATKIELIIRDSEGNIIKAVKAAQELASDNEVVALIGELGSDETTGIAVVANNSRIPLIAPVAIENGIASIGDYIFQINGDLNQRGAQIATYAIKELGLRTFATLAPTDDYGKGMTDSFTSTVDKLGGTIVAQKWYYEGTHDLSRQFKSIREIGLNRMAADSLQSIFLEEALSRREDDRDFDEIAEIPIQSIDAVFFPIYPEDIQYVAPQFAFYNIRARILGGDYWNVPEILRTNQNYVNGVIFCSGWLLDEMDPYYREFRTKFRQEMGTSPEQMEAYGYDAMKLIIQAVKDGAVSRQTILEKLNNISDFSGLRGSINFLNNHRVNSELFILTFQDGQIRRLK